MNTDRVKAGTNPLQKRPDGTSIGQETSRKRVADGTHHLLKRPDGTSHNTDKIKKGTHPFMRRTDGTSLSKDRVKNGTHPFLKTKGLVSCYDKQGNFIKIPQEQYHNQSGPKEDWEWVHNRTKEGQRRNLLKNK